MIAPLREVMQAWTDANGMERESLSCGHIVTRKQDIFGSTNAYKRRCKQCLKETQAKTQ